MKIVVVLVLALVAISSQEQTYQDVLKEWIVAITPHKQACLEESPVGDDIIQRAMEHAEFADDRALKCFGKCIHRKLNVIDDSGKINEENLKSLLKLKDGALADRIVQECKSFRGSDQCDTSFGVIKCSIKSVKKALKKAD